mgnify:CR=1 FL=1
MFALLSNIRIWKFLRIIEKFENIRLRRASILGSFSCSKTIPRAYAPIKSKLQRPPRANLEHLTTFCAQGVGNLTFVLAEWGKLSRK